MHHTGDNLQNSFVAKVISISVATQSDAPLDFVRNIPTAAVKMVDKGQINETSSSMRFCSTFQHIKGQRQHFSTSKGSDRFDGAAHQRAATACEARAASMTPTRRRATSASCYHSATAPPRREEGDRS
jgi:hypothetical protein